MKQFGAEQVFAAAGFDVAAFIQEVSLARRAHDLKAIYANLDEKQTYLAPLLMRARAVSLILDDPLVYADYTRLDLMTEMLMEAAEYMQVIILTCRERAFQQMTGNRLAL